MATTVARIDDAILGRLPAVCVRDGVPTAGRLVLSRKAAAAGFGFALGLVGLALSLLGLRGWPSLACVLTGLVVWAGGRAATSVLVPCSEPARWRLSAARWRQGTGLVVCAALALVELAAIGGRAHDADWWVATLAAALAVATSLTGVATVRAEALRVGVSLDPRRRWVTLSNVSPEFARAVDARYGGGPPVGHRPAAP